MEWSKIRIVKNVAVISTGFIFLFTAYNGLSYLQSTINQHQGIGVVSQAIIYAGFCLSAILLPKYVMKKFGCKTTILFAMILYLPYICSNFYPHWVTMIPSAILVGLGSPLLWGSQCTYLNKSSLLYSSLINGAQNVDDFSSRKTPKSNSNKRMKSKALTVKDTVINKQVTSHKSNSNEREIERRDHSNDFNLKKQKTEDPENQRKEISNSQRIYCNKTNYIARIPNETVKSHNFEDGKIKELSVHNLSHGIESGCTDSVKEVVKVTNLSINIGFTNCKNDYKLQCNFDSGFEDTKKHIRVPYENECKDVVGCQSKNNFTHYNENSIINDIDNELRDSPKETEIVPDPKIIEAVAARFFGFHGLAYHTANIWSNLISYYILQKGNDLNGTSWNSTSSCGAEFCNLESTSSNPNLVEPSEGIRNILTSIALGLSLVSVMLVFFFLDHLENDKEPIKFSLDILTSTLKFVNAKQPLLLGPLSFYIGMQQAFYIGDFTKSYIGCAWGAAHVGLVTICYGFFSAFSSTFSGWLVKYIGRIPIFITAAVINVAANVLLLFWHPNHHYPLMFFVLAGMWGCCTGMFWSQLRAFFGVLFKKNEEAAFAGFYLWDSLGYCLVFSYSNYICTSIKIYALLFVSTVGVLGYLKAESNYQTQKRQILGFTS